jgi:Zn-dependent metalloprotease
MLLASPSTTPASATSLPAGHPVSLGSIAELFSLRPNPGTAPAQGLLAYSVPAGPATRTSGVGTPESAGSLSDAVAAKAPGIAHIQRSQAGTVRWMDGNFGAVSGTTSLMATGPISNAAITPPPTDLPARILAALQPLAPILRLRDPAAELRPMNVQTDDMGFQHVRFQQIYAGIPVWARDLYVHVDGSGQLRVLNGEYDPTPVGVATAPVISADDAVGAAITNLRTEFRWSPVSNSVAAKFGYTAPQAELVIYISGGAAALAYAVTVQANLLEKWTYLVDAIAGGILHRVPEYCSVGFADASGVDLNGQTQTFRSWQNAGGEYFLFWDLPNYDAAKSQLPDSMLGGSQILDLRGQAPGASPAPTYYYTTSPNNQWADKASVSADFNAKTAYDYYHNTFSRKAIDDADGTILSVVHVADTGGGGLDNAYWNGRAMFYGDGATVFKPLAGGLDVAGHEMTHGVVQHSANLVYETQAGALNESFADFFGLMIGNPANFLIGSTVMQPGQGIALRDMGQPDNPQVYAVQPATMAAYVNTTSDNGGVHTNSGIPNHAAALIITAIGRTKAQQIYYRALTKYLTRTSQFADCRNALVQSAKDLFGAAGAEVTAVNNAFDAVGIRIPTVPPPGSIIPPVTGGTPYVTFITQDGSIGLYDPAAQTYTLFGGATKARTTAQMDDASQLSTPLDGSAIWYISQTGHLSFVDVQTGEVRYFPNLYIAKDGDLWNAVISPDGRFAVMDAAPTSADRSVYIFDGAQLYPITLDLQASDGGAVDKTIQYADVLSWSPNMGFPKIGFDGLHRTSINGNTVEYWGMGEINFTTNRIYDLEPGQPIGVSVGNPTYGNTNPDLIAYNTFTTTFAGTYIDTVIIRGGIETTLNIDQILLNDGTYVNDGQRATFSPDDTKVCFAAPQRNRLCFYDLAANNLTALSLLNNGTEFPVYNARWFVLGGSVPYTFVDVRRALAFSAGIATAGADDKTRLNLVDLGASAGKITLQDAVAIARKVVGLG